MVEEVSVEVKQNGHKRMKHTDITKGRDTSHSEKQYRKAGEERMWRKKHIKITKA